MNGIGTDYQGIGTMLRSLRSKGTLTDQEVDAIDAILELLNNAVHGARLDIKAAAWTLEYGPRILKSLDERIRANEVRESARKALRRPARQGAARRQVKGPDAGRTHSGR